MQVRPPRNQFKHFYGTKALDEGIERLLKEVESVQPNVIVPLGNEALKAITGVSGITNYRGSILSAHIGEHTYKVIPTFHPAAIARNWPWRAIAVFDLKRVRREKSYPQIRITPRELITDPSPAVMEELASRLIEDDAPVAFDIETSPDLHVTHISFTNNPEWAVSAPWNRRTQAWAKRILESPVRKYAQNAQFDVLILSLFGGINVANLYFDTMVGHHTLHPELPKSLAFLTSVYTDIPYYKDLAEYDMPRYNALDALSCHEAAGRIIRNLHEFGTWGFYLEVAHPMLYPLMKMQSRGVALDLVKRDKIATELSAELDSDIERLRRIVGYEINPFSTQQLGKLLYDEMGLPERHSRKTGGRTTDERALKSLAAKHSNPIFELVLDIRAKNKTLNTYLRIPTSADGRIRCSYNVGGSDTGRLSSSRSVFGTGTNLQNVPHGAPRAVVVPDKGLVFIGADLSQAEARVVAYLSQDSSFIELFVRGGDVHTESAGRIFGKRLEHITPAERFVGKKLIHAGNYRIGPAEFAANAGCSVAEARELLALYHSTYPGITRWWNAIDTELEKTRTLITPFGRKRMFFGRFGMDLKKAATAFVPQSTVADYTNIGLTRVDAVLEEIEQASPALNIHDALVVQCRPADGGRIQEIIRRALDIPLTIYGMTFTIPVEFKVGYNWDEV